VRRPPRPRSLPKFFLFFFRICTLYFVSFYECFYFWVFYFVLLVFGLCALRVYLRPCFCTNDGLCHRWTFEVVCSVFRTFLSHPSVRSLVYVFLRQTMLMLSFNARFASSGLAFARYRSWVGKAVQLRQPFLLGGQYTVSIRGLRSPTTAACVRTLF
jgi:hypothetical protein